MSAILLKQRQCVCECICLYSVGRSPCLQPSFLPLLFRAFFVWVVWGEEHLYTSEKGMLSELYLSVATSAVHKQAARSACSAVLWECVVPKVVATGMVILGNYMQVLGWSQRWRKTDPTPYRCASLTFLLTASIQSFSFRAHFPTIKVAEFLSTGQQKVEARRADVGRLLPFTYTAISQQWESKYVYKLSNIWFFFLRYCA